MTQPTPVETHEHCYGCGCTLDGYVCCDPHNGGLCDECHPEEA